MSVDVVVVGGGPVGLATALYAVRCGLSAVVLEPRGGVLDKACGEGLMPAGVAALAALGVHPPGRRLLGIRYVAGTRRAEAVFRHGSGRGVRRTALHDSLSTEVTAAGVEILPLAAGRIGQGGGSVQVSTSGPRQAAGPTITGRYLVAADGLHSPTRRRLGLDARVRGPRRFGLRRHYRVRPWSEHVEVHWGAGAEAYVTPVADDVVGVAVLGGQRSTFERQLAGFPLLAQRLGSAPATSDTLGAGPLRQRTNRRVSGRVLLVGDAAGYVDALTGEGVALGLAQAQAAVQALRAGRPADYEDSWRRVTRRSALLTHALVQCSRPPWLRRAIVPAAATMPWAFLAAVDELGRAG